jgi:hypothetical protein
VWVIRLTPAYMAMARDGLSKWEGNPQHGRPYNDWDTLRGICGQVAVCQASGTPYKWVSRKEENARGYDEIFLGQPCEVRTTNSRRGLRINKHEYENPTRISPRKIYVLADYDRFKENDPVVLLIKWGYFKEIYSKAIPGPQVRDSAEPYREYPRDAIDDLHDFDELILQHLTSEGRR